MPRRLVLCVLVGVSTPACFDGDAANQPGTGTASSEGSTSASPDSGSTGSVEPDSTSAVGDDTNDGDTGGATSGPGSTSISTSTSDGGCMPGVFGSSLFGDACFQ